MRLELPLNDGWTSCPRPPSNFVETSFNEGADPQAPWVPTRIPHTNLELPLENFDPQGHQFITGYRRHLDLEEAWCSQRLFLVFEAVMARAEVWVEGIRVAEHRGGFTGFEVEIPAELATPRALVAVVADANEDPGIPPFGHAVDYLTYGGIYREVHLEIRPHRYIADLTIETPAPGLGHPLVRGTFRLDGPWDGEMPLIGTVRIKDHRTGETRAQAAVGWAPGAQETPYEVEIPGAGTWDLDSPELYDLVVETNEDRLSRTFGFRQARFTAQGFWLNGRKVKLRGLNRHQCWPTVGYAMPRRAQAADADLLKALGCNMTRTSHYPASRHFLDRCDEIGLLVFEEIPGWQHIGDEAWKKVALQNVEEMILRDRHRPSIVLWGVRINESADDDFYEKTNALAKALDPTRATGGVRNFSGSRLLEDVYTYNDFVHDGSNRPLASRSQIAGAKVPYLVTEHNGHMFPTKKADPEARRVDQALRHARVQNAAAADPQISGALGWCFADYATHGDFGSGDQICHHGVVDQFRCLKPAGAFYASQRAEPFGQVASRWAIGDHDAAVLPELWVFTNSAEVRVFEGDRHIGTFGPHRTLFPALPHPPVLVDDLIGDAIEGEPGLSRTQARRVKAFLQAYQKRGRLPSLRFLLPMVLVMAQKKWTTKDVHELYGRYVTGWGAKSRAIRFEGWSRANKEWEQTLGPTHAAALELTVDASSLAEGDTWDVVRAEVRLLDTHGNEVWYGATVVTIEVAGPLALQGPAYRPLQGGSTAFWLATTGRPGSATLRAKTDHLVSQAVVVTVR